MINCYQLLNSVLNTATCRAGVFASFISVSDVGTEKDVKYVYIFMWNIYMYSIFMYGCIVLWLIKWNVRFKSFNDHIKPHPHLCLGWEDAGWPPGWWTGQTWFHWATGSRFWTVSSERAGRWDWLLHSCSVGGRSPEEKRRTELVMVQKLVLSTKGWTKVQQPLNCTSAASRGQSGRVHHR